MAQRGENDNLYTSWNKPSKIISDLRFNLYLYNQKATSLFNASFFHLSMVREHKPPVQDGTKGMSFFKESGILYCLLRIYSTGSLASLKADSQVGFEPHSLETLQQKKNRVKELLSSKVSKATAVIFSIHS